MVSYSDICTYFNAAKGIELEEHFVKIYKNNIKVSISSTHRDVFEFEVVFKNIRTLSNKYYTKEQKNHRIIVVTAGAGRQPCKSWVTGLWPDFDV